MISCIWWFFGIHRFSENRSLLRIASDRIWWCFWHSQIFWQLFSFENCIWSHLMVFLAFTLFLTRGGCQNCAPIELQLVEKRVENLEKSPGDSHIHRNVWKGNFFRKVCSSRYDNLKTNVLSSKCEKWSWYVQYHFYRRAGLTKDSIEKVPSVAKLIVTIKDSYLIFVTGTTGGAFGEQICHVEQFIQTDCHV